MTRNDNMIVGIGNALVDVVASVPPDAPARHGLTHGGMHLVDAQSAEAHYADVGPGVQQSGGSVANSIAHLADSGVSGCFLGKVADDELGARFRKEMLQLGIGCPVPPLQNGPATGRCVVMVTPDGERTMSTYLGAAQRLEPTDVVAAIPARFDMLLVEGYLFDPPKGGDAIRTAAEKAKAIGARVVLTPSDVGCVERNREEILAFIRDYCDVLIGNHAEAQALSGVDDLDMATDWALAQVGVVAITENSNGSRVADCNCRHRIPAVVVERVLDTTGSGDAYASAFLAGLVCGLPIEVAARDGAELASRVIMQYGAAARAEVAG